LGEDAKIGKGFIHTFSEEKLPMYQIIQTIKEFVGGTMYKGLDDIQDLQAQMLNLFQNLMSVYLKAMKTYKMLSKNIYKKMQILEQLSDS
jgi:hypothetical protein